MTSRSRSAPKTQLHPGGATRRRLHPLVLLARGPLGRRQLPHVPGRGRRPEGRQASPCSRRSFPAARRRSRTAPSSSPANTTSAIPPFRPSPTTRLQKGGQPGQRAKKSQADTLEGLAHQPPARLPRLRQGRRVHAAGLLLPLRPFRTADDRREEHAAEQAGISSKITLFTDRCIMCTRCVRFTREISGTAELLVDRAAAITRRSTSSPAGRWRTSWRATSSTSARSARSAARTSSTSSASGI